LEKWESHVETPEKFEIFEFSGDDIKQSGRDLLTSCAVLILTHACGILIDKKPLHA